MKKELPPSELPMEEISKLQKRRTDTEEQLRAGGATYEGADLIITDRQTTGAEADMVKEMFEKPTRERLQFLTQELSAAVSDLGAGKGNLDDIKVLSSAINDQVKNFKNRTNFNNQDFFNYKESQEVNGIKISIGHDSWMFARFNNPDAGYYLAIGDDHGVELPSGADASSAEKVFHYAVTAAKVVTSEKQLASIIKKFVNQQEKPSEQQSVSRKISELGEKWRQEDLEVDDYVKSHHSS